MAGNLAPADCQSRIRTGRSLVPDLPLDKIAAQRGTRHTNSGYWFADSRHATVTERASGWRIISMCRSCPQAAHAPRPQLVPHELGPFLWQVKEAALAGLVGTVLASLRDHKGQGI